MKTSLLKNPLPAAAVALVALLALSSCDSFVSDVEDPTDQVPDDQLNNTEQVPFLISGVQARYASTLDLAGDLSGGLSDELLFGPLPSSTFPTFQQIDDGEIAFTNNSVDGLYENLGELRFFSDNLVQRVQNNIEFGEGEQELKTRALYVGQLYGGIARHFYATYFGLNAGEGGGSPVNGGEFVPSAQLYDRAVADFDSALTVVASGSYRARLLNSMKARSYLYKAGLDGANAGQAYQNAQSAAANGLEQGDSPFQGRYTTEALNDFYFDAGPGRAQFRVANRYYTDYEETALLPGPDPDLGAEALDTARVVLYPTKATQANLTIGSTDSLVVEQGLYLERSSPINAMTWQENTLMRAELALRVDDDSDTALELVNAVRASHSLDPLESISLKGDGENDIATERAKELFATGARLPDQRRFGIPFTTLDPQLNEISLPGPWRYLPITQDERQQNPNIGPGS